MKSIRLRRWASLTAATVLAVTAAVVGVASPAFAEPHADAKYCDNNDGIYYKSVGYPYGSQEIYGTKPELRTAGNNASAYGRAYLKAGDYFSIDRTNDKVPPSDPHYKQYTTSELAAKFGGDFTWHYCEKITPDGFVEYDRAPFDGWYNTRLIDGAHRGIRLCITRPSVSDKAVCVGENTSPGGWYVDNDDDSNDWFYIAPGSTTPDEPDPPSTSTSSLVAFQANTGFLFTRDANGAMVDTRYGMMRGTSPATSNGQVAFQANTGFLFTRATNGAMHDTQLGMMAGTSPSISGGQIAFQANTSLLFTRNMSTGKTVDLRLGLMAGTSPSIAGDTGSWRIAFQANDGFLYYRDSGGATVNTGFGMMRGTSPSIAKLSNGGYVIAFQANTGLLWILNSNGTGTDLRLGLMTDTSPAISASGTSWTIAFQANTGFLFTRNSAGSTVDTRYGMMAHTSPSVRGSRIVFQANDGFLYYRDGSSAAVNTAYGMMAGTNPAA
ncbi:hypothetical protein ACFFHJ_06435 [Planotetraspora thailandica]|uniref:hypothetical protein n=1 Tax=Planotetraspora thailandica TaxID=487172 RepID=UPI00194E339E|nr:hypothetical protein [Planotetraspora thailandica]